MMWFSRQLFWFVVAVVIACSSTSCGGSSSSSTGKVRNGLTSSRLGRVDIPNSGRTSSNDDGQKSRSLRSPQLAVGGGDFKTETTTNNNNADCIMDTDTYGEVLKDCMMCIATAMTSSTTTTTTTSITSTIRSTFGGATTNTMVADDVAVAHSLATSLSCEELNGKICFAVTEHCSTQCKKKDQCEHHITALATLSHYSAYNDRHQPDSQHCTYRPCLPVGKKDVMDA